MAKKKRKTKPKNDFLKEVDRWIERSLSELGVSPKRKRKKRK